MVQPQASSMYIHFQGLVAASVPGIIIWSEAGPPACTLVGPVLDSWPHVPFLMGRPSAYLFGLRVGQEKFPRSSSISAPLVHHRFLRKPIKCNQCLVNFK
jgi:hypothetical protein